MAPHLYRYKEMQKQLQQLFFSVLIYFRVFTLDFFTFLHHLEKALLEKTHEPKSMLVYFCQPGNTRVRVVYRGVWIVVVHLQHASWTEDFQSLIIAV